MNQTDVVHFLYGISDYFYVKTKYKLAVYSIKDLEKLCGIKAHTLRVWEQRYGIVKPQRSKTNIRYYEDEDLKKLLNISLLNRNGIRISKIAKMSPDEINEKVSTFSAVNFEPGTQLDALTLSMIEMDESKFDRIISTNINQYGFEKTMLEVIHPFLEKAGLLWLTGSLKPIQENFMSYLVRQKIITAIDKVAIAPDNNTKTFMIYLPEGESQELSLLFVNYLIKQRGHCVIYLGLNTSLNDLTDACSIKRPDFIFTMITETYSSQPIQDYVDELSKAFDESTILISGYQVVAQRVPTCGNVRVLLGLEDMIRFIDKVKA